MPRFDGEQLRLALELRPRVVSFHFGLPAPDALKRLKQAGIVVLSSATTVAEARRLEAAGADAIIAQGFEAGGHRGTFTEGGGAGLIGTMALVPQIVDAVRAPVIAAGGIADGRGIAAALALGASGAQIGTAFLGCPEATVPSIHRKALHRAADEDTRLTRVFTGRPARAFNRLTDEMGEAEALDFPAQAGVMRALLRATSEAARTAFLPMWAGQAAPLVRDLLNLVPIRQRGEPPRLVRALPAGSKRRILEERPVSGGVPAIMSRKEIRRPAMRAAVAPSSALAARILDLQRQATAHAQAGRPRRALAACRELLALLPDRPDVPAFAGILALRAGDAEEAVTLYRRALALKPDFVEVHYNLGNALGALGRFAEAVAAYRRATALRPDFMPAHHHLGNALRALGRPAEAVEAYRRALALQATAAGERDLGIALHELQRLDEAIAAYRRSLALPDHRTDVLSNLANALMERGDRHGAIEVCDRYLAHEPGNIEALALKALALNELGDRESARFLLDFDRFVQIIDFVDPPPGYPSLAAFNAALVDHVEAHPTLHVPPKDHPTYHNDALEITGELFVEPKGPMAAFETMMKRAVARYVETVPRHPPHPFLDRFPKKWVLACWATRLNGQGNLDPHIHFTGYLGGVYYPLLPAIVAREDQGGAGWFELGRPPERFACRAEPSVRRIQPKEGRLLLFPGYFFHNTIPFTATERRISIAFDVMPRE